MVQGIAIIGPNGSGKSTLNHLLCKEIGYFEIDTEDYYFPAQKAGRQWLLEHGTALPEGENGLPYASSCSREEAEQAILRDMQAHPRFVLSCVNPNWCGETLGRIGVAFRLEAPLETRLERIHAREVQRFGRRALPGGDLYLQQEGFCEKVRRRTLADEKKSVAALRCPVLVLDGTRPPQENLQRMLAWLAGW